MVNSTWRVASADNWKQGTRNMRPVGWNSKHHNCGFRPSPIPQVHVGGSSGHSSRKDSLEGFLLEPSCREIPAVENVAASARGLSLGSAPRHTRKARVHDLDKPTQQTACEGSFSTGVSPKKQQPVLLEGTFPCALGIWTCES